MFNLLIPPGHFYGHTHRDEVRLHLIHSTTTNEQTAFAKSFALMAPSISPAIRNNRVFRMMSLNRQERALLVYDQYFMDLA